MNYKESKYRIVIFRFNNIVQSIFVRPRGGFMKFWNCIPLPWRWYTAVAKFHVEILNGTVTWADDLCDLMAYAKSL